MAYQKPGKRTYNEDRFQVGVARTLDSLGWLWWHTPNGQQRNVIVGKKLKLAGVKRGIPDVIIAEPWFCCAIGCVVCGGVGSGRVVAIELKTPGNYPTKDQRLVLSALRDRGWLAVVCKSMDDVISVLKKVKPMNGVTIA